MSMPLDTPAAVMMRSLEVLDDPLARSGSRRACRASSIGRQWVVAVRPSSRPAAASTSEPVHTDVVNVVVAWAVRTQSSTRSSLHERAGADAAGEHDDVGRRHLVERGVDLDPEEAVVGAHDAHGAWPTNVTS